ncbi:MAG TPA: peptidoglycan-binding protein [Paludibaculum sp.]|jgi:peptidoglycan hydrolase-like protein with peptidoglycan-binding domain
MATSSASAASITGPLFVGSRGNDVRVVQAALNRATIPSPGLTEDGNFGMKTAAAARAFQAANGLVVDGIVGPRTSAALGLQFVRRAPPPVKPDPPGTPQPGAGNAPQLFLLHLIAQEIKRIAHRLDVIFDNGFDETEDAARRRRKFLKIAQNHALFILSTAAAPAAGADTVANLTSLSLFALAGGLGPVAAEAARGGGDSTEILSTMSDLSAISPQVAVIVRRTLAGQMEGGLRAGRDQIRELLDPLCD